MNAYATFARAFAPRLDAVLFEGDAGERYTYADLERETARVAALLTRLGLAPGDRVAAQIDKSPQGLFLYLGCLRAGLAFLPLNTAYQRGELAYFLGDAEPRVVVCRPALHDTFKSLGGPAMTLMTLDERGAGTFSDALSGASTAFQPVDTPDDALAVLIYTSGTTGRAKGAMVTHGNLAANARALTDAWRFTARDVLIHALPVFHVHGLFVAFHTVLLAGAKILFHRRFDPAAVLRDLPRATALMGVPTFYVRLLQEPALTRAAVAHMRLFVSGSAPLLLDTFEAWRERTGHTILERYGMSEAGMITSNPYEGERRGGTVGLPLPGNRVRVRDGERECGPGESGGIEISGPNVFAGYWRLPDKTREEFTADGWFRTGDVGQWSRDGYLSIVGRARDLIISGGYNVYPKEIELVIDAIPGVVESAVVGVPHADFGEAVSAVIVKAPGATIDEPAVIARVKAEIAAYKVPKRVVFIDELPRNAMGKVQKALLREHLAEETDRRAN
jgi:malonyl-CoA/methylmalonyl-CoA synthetase